MINHQFEHRVIQLLESSNLNEDEIGKLVDNVCTAIGEMISAYEERGMGFDLKKIIDDEINLYQLPPSALPRLLKFVIKNRADWIDLNTDEDDEYIQPVIDYLTKLAAPYIKVQKAGGKSAASILDI